MNSDQNKIDHIFDKMRENGWDIEQPLKWGHFFFHSSAPALMGFIKTMEAKSYTVESLHKNNDGNWVLHISKTEILSSQELQKRKLQLIALSQLNNIDRYDGWDVEKP